MRRQSRHDRKSYVEIFSRPTELPYMPFET